jgi:hypothetical protein
MISSLEMIYYGDITARAGSMIELPIEVTTGMELSAFSLILDIPTHLVQVEDVYLKDGLDPNVPGVLDWALDGNILRIGWFSAGPISLQASSRLITLELSLTYNFLEGNTVAISLVDDPLNEVAGPDYEAIENAVLQTYYIAAYSTGIALPGDQKAGPELYCHPNPFNENTTLKYTLPEKGEVIVELVNKFGARIEKYVDGIQDKGQYSINIEGLKLNPGIYTVILYYNSGGKIVKKSVKIVRGV